MTLRRESTSGVSVSEGEVAVCREYGVMVLRRLMVVVSGSSRMLKRASVVVRGGKGREVGRGRALKRESSEEGEQ